MQGTVVLLPAQQWQLVGTPAPGLGQEPPRVSSGFDRRSLAAELAAYAIPIFRPTDPPHLTAYGSGGPADPAGPSGPSERELNAHWVAHVSVEITRHQPQAPLLLVASGVATARLCALGFAQKASRHAVSGYVIIDGLLPETGRADWPNAPVDFVLTPEADETARQAARVAELRGWTCHRDADPATVIRQLVRG